MNERSGARQRSAFVSFAEIGQITIDALVHFKPIENTLLAKVLPGYRRDLPIAETIHRTSTGWKNQNFLLVQPLLSFTTLGNTHQATPALHQRYTSAKTATDQRHHSATATIIANPAPHPYYATLPHPCHATSAPHPSYASTRQMTLLLQQASKRAPRFPAVPVGNVRHFFLFSFFPFLILVPRSIMVYCFYG